MLHNLRDCLDQTMIVWVMTNHVITYIVYKTVWRTCWSFCAHHLPYSRCACNFLGPTKHATIMHVTNLGTWMSSQNLLSNSGLCMGGTKWRFKLQNILLGKLVFVQVFSWHSIQRDTWKLSNHRNSCRRLFQQFHKICTLQQLPAVK